MMNLRLLPVSTIALLLFAGSAFAQSAFRCDQDGKTVYSDKPCPAAKVVAPTHDSAEQKAAAKEANAQMRKDAGDINRRLSEREKLEAQERAAARKAAAAAARQEAKQAQAARAADARAKATAKKAKASASKAGNSKASKKSATSASKKADNKASSS